MNDEQRLRRNEKWRWVFTGRLVTQIPLGAYLRRQILEELGELEQVIPQGRWPALEQAIYAAVLQQEGAVSDGAEAWRALVPASEHRAVERMVRRVGQGLVRDYQKRLLSHWRSGTEGLVDAALYHERLRQALSEHVEALGALLAEALGDDELLRRVDQFERDWANQVPADVLLTPDEGTSMG